MVISISRLLLTIIFISSYTITFGQKKPNIVLFFVDDMGWADVNFRNSKLHTPNLDQLRKDGLEFTRAYIATPTCSPSRASLLTGKEPVRFQMSRHAESGNHDEFHIWETDPVQRPSRNWLPLEEVTYAEALKEIGYYNYFIGKWHLGHEPFYPVHQGFDAQFYTNEYGHPKSYYPPYFKDGNPFPNTDSLDYLTDILTDESVRFIEDYNESKPFMLSFWYFNVHGPHIGRKDWVKKYKNLGLEGKFAEYAAMLSTMDESIGRVRLSLENKGIAKNTVIIFLSDQGGQFKNGPLSGGKIGGNTLGEGGARVPMYILYPGFTKPNTTCDIPVQSLDIFPTLVEIASGKRYKNKSVQGKSLMPLLKGKEIKKRDLFFFRSYEDQYAAVISGDWKLVKYHSGKYQLFNLGKDISEKNNLIGKGYKQENTLKKKLMNWEVEAVPPF